MNFIDLAGKKFEHLTVLYRAEDLIRKNNKHRTRWHCICECGNEFDVLSDNLRKRPNMTCQECANKRRAENNRTDVVGNKYGRLTILEILWDEPRAKAMCKCDCGNNYVADKTSVVTGHTQSCGCLQSEKTSISNTKDWTNHISQSGVKLLRQHHKNDKGQWIWECKCPLCNGLFYELPAKVNNGHTTSCGCRNQSFGEEYIQSILRKMNVQFKPQYTFNDCKNTYVLRFDFGVLYNKNLIGLIEFDGKQHFYPVDFFGGNDGFQKTIRRDKIKNEYCQNNNIPLLRLPYTLSLEEIENKIYEYYESLTTAGCV